MLENTIGDRIKYLREALNKKQFEFANDLDVHEQTIGRYERNEIFPHGPVLEKIIIKYNANPTWLFTGEGDPFKEGTEIGKKEAIVKAVTFLNQMDTDQIRDSLKFLEQKILLDKLVKEHRKKKENK